MFKKSLIGVAALIMAASVSAFGFVPADKADAASTSRVQHARTTPNPACDRPQPQATRPATPPATPSAQPELPSAAKAAAPKVAPSSAPAQSRREVRDPYGNGQPCPGTVAKVHAQGLNTGGNPGSGCFGVTWHTSTIWDVPVYYTSDRIFISSGDTCTFDRNFRTVVTLDMDGWFKVFDFYQPTQTWTLIWHAGNNGYPNTPWQARTQTAYADYILYQTDNNLVAYTVGGSPRWSSWTLQAGLAFGTAQSDGNFCIYLNYQTAGWCTDTNY
ncbi:hypothetical protein Lfu02_55340 [Longispora fulva]|uniref:Uncharacterized protein n=1 Tax=Longispora fulva TaxID=619741 RepID=A0A8J7GEW4_9ACTN|nr:hypothetical protein [Longispora fulva]MBG6137484.1 hypothetical protein [Longispora fulva]GIG61162.1 hypothetical protein Lfu02_55340 [Longispora fulva]